MTNHLQAVLGYMELTNYDKALVALHDTIGDVTALGRDLCLVTKTYELCGLEELTKLRIVQKTVSTSTTTTTASRIKGGKPKSKTTTKTKTTTSKAKKAA